MSSNIDILSKKYNENWDSYGGNAIDNIVVGRVKSIIEKLGEVDSIFIIPAPNGSIQLEYEDEEKYLEVEVHSDKYEYLFIDHETTFSIEETINDEEDIISLLRGVTTSN